MTAVYCLSCIAGTALLFCTMMGIACLMRSSQITQDEERMGIPWH